MTDNHSHHEDRGLGPPKSMDARPVTVRAECQRCKTKRLHRCKLREDGNVACVCLTCERVVVGK